MFGGNKVKPIETLPVQFFAFQWDQIQALAKQFDASQVAFNLLSVMTRFLWKLPTIEQLEAKLQAGFTVNPHIQAI